MLLVTSNHQAHLVCIHKIPICLLLACLYLYLDSLIAKSSAFWLQKPRLARVVCELLCQRRHVWDKVVPFVLQPWFPHKEVVQDYFKHSYESASSTFHECILKHRLASTIQELRDTVAPELPVTIIYSKSDENVPVKSIHQLANLFRTDEQQQIAKQVTKRRPSSSSAHTVVVAVQGNHDFPLVCAKTTSELIGQHLSL